MLEFESPTWGREKVPMKYSPERREAILAKLEAPYNRTVNDLAGEEGISAATIYNWRKQTRSTGRLLPNASPTTEGWSGVCQCSWNMSHAASSSLCTWITV